jgi:carboxyl-terminal processing protease
MILVALVGFVAGTRSSQLYASVAPLFGIKASADTLELQLVQKTYQELKANYDGTLDSTKLVDGAARGMVAAAGDRYTVFMDQTESADFAKQLSGEVSGIGCEIGVRSNQPTILRVLTDSPAEQSGVKAGDVITAVNGESVDASDSATVAEKIRGEAGTSVKVKVLRGSEVHEFTITRAKISDPSVRWSVSDGIGTMIISRFDQDTGVLARKAATEFKAQNVRGVVLDLRDDGGGYLDAARDVAGIWLSNKKVVTEKTDGKVTDTVTTESNPVLAGVKTVVLVNGGSASASEIVAGALQDYKVATLVGERTFGKGTVQKLIELPDGRQLKVTIARWYTPNGKNITKDGITPDTKVQLTSEDMNAGRDPQADDARAAL